MEEKGKRNKLRADLLLILALALLAGGALLWQRLGRSGGALAVVYVENRPVAEYPLNRDGRFPLETEWGHNLLVIEDGAAFMGEADCPDRLCMYMHPIRYAGETITCLPHRLQIRVEGPGEGTVDIP